MGVGEGEAVGFGVGLGVEGGAVGLTYGVCVGLGWELPVLTALTVTVATVELIAAPTLSVV